MWFLLPLLFIGAVALTVSVLIKKIKNLIRENQRLQQQLYNENLQAKIRRIKNDGNYNVVDIDLYNSKKKLDSLVVKAEDIDSEIYEGKVITIEAPMQEIVYYDNSGWF